MAFALAKEAYSDPRVALDELHEGGRSHDERVDRLERDGGRRAGPAVDRGQLSDEIAWFLDR